MCTKEEELDKLLHNIDAALRSSGADDGAVSTLQLGAVSGHDKVVNGVKSLMARGYVTLEEAKSRCYTLTAEGSLYASEGSPEFKVFLRVKSTSAVSIHKGNYKKLQPMPLAEATAGITNAEHGVNKAVRSGLLRRGAGQLLSLGPSAKSDPDIGDTTQKLLELIRTLGGSEENMLAEMRTVIADAEKLRKELDDLKKRKLIDVKMSVSYLVRKTDQFQCKYVQQVTDLTQELLQERKTWSAADMKPYNFFSSGKRIQRGYLHPITRSLREFREIFLSMGFEELDTSNYVESSFWCFDSLYIPQQHPARDSQDTFFTKLPDMADTSLMQQPYIDAVAKVHGDGSLYDSTGWQYDWKLEESRKLVLRTHTTACTARLLKAMADDFDHVQHTLPRKFFSIDRVFRNENMDATHLCEFHQVEGFMIGFGMGLSHLMGVLSSFYSAIGIEKLKYKPAYNPYTEPSMEIFGYHPDMKKWVEIGNSGIFRPEMLRPMGFPKGVSVVAWGLSLERPTMIRHNISNIRNLVGCNY